MTDAELSEILTNGGKVAVPYFDGALVEVMPDDIEDLPTPSGAVTEVEALEMLKNFLNLTIENRDADSRHLFAYCKLMMDAVGKEEVLEDLDGVMPTLGEIWKFVTPKVIFFGALNPGKYATTRTVFLQIEGDVAWEPEHGLQMSWQNGATLVKAGAYDGHPTNGHAYGDPDRDVYVFYCNQPENCTNREGE